MVSNRIYLSNDNVMICNINDNDLKAIRDLVKISGCVMQVTEDDENMFTVVVIGVERELYNFMLCAFYGLSGYIFCTF